MVKVGKVKSAYEPSGSFMVLYCCIMYLLAEVLVGAVTSFGGSLMEQKIDNDRINLRKALEDGVNGAISSALPGLGGTPSKSGNF